MLVWSEVIAPSHSRDSEFAAPATGVYRNRTGKPVLDTALFSFEGMNSREFYSSQEEIDSSVESITASLVFENCIEKNFHVS